MMTWNLVLLILLIQLQKFIMIISKNPLVKINTKFKYSPWIDNKI